MNGMSEELRRSCDLLRRLAAFLVVAAGLLPSAPALAGKPSDIESKLTLTIGGSEKQLTLAEAMTALNIPAASIALIDQDRIAFARAYGEGATPDTLFQAASLSKFVAAVSAMRLVDQKRLSLDSDVNAALTSWKVPANAFDKEARSRCAAS
jgi:CubicO group peptidase (beta-lactamase class C family)